MSKERIYDVNCPRSYGFVKFMVAANVISCPVSGAVNCLRCDIATMEDAMKKGQIVMKEEK